MNNRTVIVAVSNQKGGVGKSTILVTLASYLNYSVGKNVAIVDCDPTQRSLIRLRERDKATMGKSNRLMALLDRAKERADVKSILLLPLNRRMPERLLPILRQREITM